MMNLRSTTLAAGTTVLLAAGTVLAAVPAHADGPEKDREFRVAGAEVDFSVSKDDGRFEVDVDIDDAQPGSRWRVVLWHDGKRFHDKVHRADGDGDVDIDKDRRDTRGADTFKIRVEKIGGGAATRTIRMR